VEFFVGLTPARDDIASPLAAHAVYAFEENVSIGYDQAVPTGNQL
jgi:hypothetical protein